MSEHEQRHFQRLSLRLPALMHWKGHEYEVNIVDLSLKGVLIQHGAAPQEHSAHENLAAEIAKGARPQVELILLSDPERIELFRMDMELIHQHGERFGGEWVNIDVDALARLRSVLDYNLGDVNLVERELSELWQ